MGKASISIVCALSQKNGKPYKALVADFGWSRRVISFEINLLLHFVSFQELSSLNINEEIPLGEVDVHI